MKNLEIKCFKCGCTVIKIITISNIVLFLFPGKQINHDNVYVYVCGKNIFDLHIKFSLIIIKTGLDYTRKIN